VEAPQFNDKGELLFPAGYREWVHLSSGLGMTYGPAAKATLNNPSFDNVYVNPAAWKAFKETGSWPEGSIFALEIRYSSSHGSINKAGFFQSDVAAVEAAVKDTKRFPRGWAYFGFEGGLRPFKQSAAALGTTAGCNACHEANGAVENTFTQFYPMALEVAEKKSIFKASFHQPGPEASPARLMHAISALPDADIGRVLDTAKGAEPEAPALQETSLNQIGYALLQAGNTASAIAVFHWNAQANLTSANAVDSLAEAYEAGGKIELARVATERAIQVLKVDQAIAPERKAAVQKALDERLVRLRAASKP
jgi:tetratricopeptide (TPR) repeat protein